MSLTVRDIPALWGPACLSVAWIGHFLLAPSFKDQSERYPILAVLTIPPDQVFKGDKKKRENFNLKTAKAFSPVKNTSESFSED